MRQRIIFLVLGLVMLLAACAPAEISPGSGSVPTAASAATSATPTTSSKTGGETTPTGVTIIASTPVSSGEGSAGGPVVSTVMPAAGKPLREITPQLTPPVEPTLTLIPTLTGGGLGPSELKYRVLKAFPDLFFCDPDFYPIARADETALALARFPELQANTEEFQAILAHNQLTGATSFSEEQKLLIYREHKRLAAIPFTLTGTGYQFALTSAKTEGQGERVSGLVDGSGKVSIQKREPTIATCPICLARNTRIATPNGSIAVQDLRPGMLVWTVDEGGTRVARPLVRVSSAIVPASHRVVHLVLSDGRELWVSPAHPLTDGRPVGSLRPGDALDGTRVLSVAREPYHQPATYDLLPDSPTGFYWANGILMASTLK